MGAITDPCPAASHQPHGLSLCPQGKVLLKVGPHVPCYVLKLCINDLLLHFSFCDLLLSPQSRAWDPSTLVRAFSLTAVYNAAVYTCRLLQRTQIPERQLRPSLKTSLLANLLVSQKLYF